MTNTLESEKLLDEVGKQILSLLQEQARLSFADIGRRVGLTAPAVAERVRRMEEVGIIRGYHAEIHPQKIGLAVTAIIRIQPFGNTCIQIPAVIQKIPAVVEGHRGTGEYILKVHVASMAHLEEVINQLIMYGQVVTTIILSTPVQKYTLEAAV